MRRRAWSYAAGPPPRFTESTLLPHSNSPLSIEGRRRLVERCRSRPIAHVAAEMGISRACASKWVNRYRRYGELGLCDRPSTPRRQPHATPGNVVVRIEQMRRDHKWSAGRITFELHVEGVPICRRTVSRHLAALGLNRRRFIDPSGDLNREPRKINARWPGHMVHLDVKKAGRIPDGGGWRIHGRDSTQAKNVDQAKTGRANAAATYTCTQQLTDSLDSRTPRRCPTRREAVTAHAFLAQSQGVVCSPRHYPHQSRRHRQRGVLPRR